MEELVKAVAEKFDLEIDQVSIVVYGIDLSGRFYLENDEDDTMSDILVSFHNYDELTVENIKNCKYNVYERCFLIKE